MSAATQATLVSVVIPTYKREHLIARAVGSVLSQTHRNMEILVVNDGPPDGTAETLALMADDRIRLIQHERNLGSSAARNTGITSAKADFIAFLDSDDEWLPEKLERQLEAFSRATKKTGVVYTLRYATSDGVNRTIPPSPLKKTAGDIRESILWETAITPQVAMVRAECFKNVGLFDSRAVPFEDWELWIRMARQYEFALIEEPLAVIHADPAEDHLSGSVTGTRKALEYVMEKHAAAFAAADAATRGKQYYLLGNLLCRDGEMARGREFLARAVRAYPLKLKYAAALVLALAGVAPGTLLSRLRGPAKAR